MSGTVTRVVRCHAVAPSTRAASLISCGTAWMAATNRIIPKPSTFHTTDTMTAHVDTVGSTPSHSTGSSMIPRSTSMRLTRPYRALNSQYHSRLDAASPMTTGMNTTPLVNRRSRVLVTVSRAMR